MKSGRILLPPNAAPWLIAAVLHVAMLASVYLVITATPQIRNPSQLFAWASFKVAIAAALALLLVLKWRRPLIVSLHHLYRFNVSSGGTALLLGGLVLALVVSAPDLNDLVNAERHLSIFTDLWQAAAILVLITVAAVAAERLRTRIAAGLPPPSVRQTSATAVGLMLLAFLLAPALPLSASLPLVAVASIAIGQPPRRRLIYAGVGVTLLGIVIALSGPYRRIRMFSAWFGTPDVTGRHYQWAKVYQTLQDAPLFGPAEVAVRIPRGEDQLLLARLASHIGTIPTLLLAACIITLALWTWSRCRNAPVGWHGRNVLRNMGLVASGMLLVTVALSLLANFAISRVPYGMGTAFYSPQLPVLVLSAVALIAASLAPRRHVSTRPASHLRWAESRLTQLSGVLLLAACVWSVIEIPDNPIRGPHTPPERAEILDRYGRVLAYTDIVKTGPGERKAVRRYPDGAATAHLLGFVQGDGSYGQEGLELAMNDRLAAKNKGPFAPARLEAVRTTVDRDIQRVAHAAIVEAATREKATAGAVVVLDQWGHIRALTSFPHYNPDDPGFRKALDPEYRVLFNHYSAESFSPNELLTPLLAASWLQHLDILQTMKVDVTPFSIHGEDIRDVRDTPPLSVSEAIAKSSRVAHAKIALLFAPKHWTSYLRDLGLGDYPRTPGIPGQTPGRVPAYCQLNPKRQATLGFPQVGKDGKLSVDATVEVSLLQIASAYLPLANGSGMPPHLSLLSEETPPLNVVLTKGAIKQTRELLEEAVSPRGTGFKARVPGVRVGGKTASIHMPPVHKDPARNIAAFVGLAPIDDPQYVVAVMLEVEGPGNRILLGGEVAAPVFSQIVRDTMTVKRRSGL